MTTTTTTETRPMPSVDFSQLAESVRGEVILRGDEGFEAARRVHDFSFDRWPVAIVRCADGTDVARAVRFALDYELPLSVRSGGHSVIGAGVLDDALVVDMSALNGVAVDPVTSTARVQPGATSDVLANALHEYGLALTTGDTSSVGIGGLTLGGGLGYMVRKYGLTIDNLLAIEMVTAEGRMVRASANEHPELFWALRGGGGNFGIVTEFTFKCAPVRDILGGMIFVPATAEAVRGYLEYAPNAPEDLTTMAHIMHAPPAPFIPAERVGELVLGIIVCWAGDSEAGRAALAPLYALGETVADVVDVMPYPSIYAFMAEAAAPHAAEVRSMFSQDLSDETIEKLLELPQEIANKRGRRAVLILDEFQEIVKLDATFPNLMRAVFQTQPEVGHLYLGSKRHVMDKIFNDKNEPFWRAAKRLELGMIPPAKFAPFIRERFESTDKGIRDAALELLLGATGGHPYGTQQLAYTTWELVPTGHFAHPRDVEAALTKVLRGEHNHFSKIWDEATEHQRLLMLALALEPSGLYSREYHHRHGLVSNTHVQRAASTLIKDEIVGRDEHGVHSIIEPFFAAWLTREQADSPVLERLRAATSA